MQCWVQIRSRRSGSAVVLQLGVRRVLHGAAPHLSGSGLVVNVIADVMQHARTSAMLRCAARPSISAASVELSMV